MQQTSTTSFSIELSAPTMSVVNGMMISNSSPSSSSIISSSQIETSNASTVCSVSSLIPSATTIPLASHHSRLPLVALLDTRDCLLEMPILRHLATVAFCDATHCGEIHEKVLREAFAVLVFRNNGIQLDSTQLQRFKALRLIVRVASNYENIDVEAASQLGIAVCNVPGVGVEETADTTLAHILALYRRTHWQAHSMQLQKHNAPGTLGALESWQREHRRPEQLGTLTGGSARIRGDTLGLVGMGRVAVAVAMRAKTFGLNVIFYDPYLPDGRETSLGGLHRVYTFEKLLRESDCISFHCSLNPENRHMLNENTMELVRPGAFLVNTACAGLIDEAALARALKIGRLRGAALDVFSDPTIPEHTLPLVLQDAPNLIVTPNSAGFSENNAKEARIQAAQIVQSALLHTNDANSFVSSLKNCINTNQLLINGRTETSTAVVGVSGKILSSNIAATAATSSTSLIPLSVVQPIQQQQQNFTTDSTSEAITALMNGVLAASAGIIPGIVSASSLSESLNQHQQTQSSLPTIPNLLGQTQQISNALSNTNTMPILPALLPLAANGQIPANLELQLAIAIAAMNNVSETTNNTANPMNALSLPSSETLSQTLSQIAAINNNDTNNNATMFANNSAFSTAQLTPNACILPTLTPLLASNLVALPSSPSSLLSSCNGIPSIAPSATSEIQLNDLVQRFCSSEMVDAYGLRTKQESLSTK